MCALPGGRASGALKERPRPVEEIGVNTPIYLALLVAVAPVAKARLTAYVLRDVADEPTVSRPRLDAALARTPR